MKEELKTLKDIEVKPEFDEGTQFTPYVHTELLKAEAIKWIKYLKYMQSQIKPPSNINAIYLSFTDRIDWIKHFFNLTKEDLQEKEKWKPKKNVTNVEIK